MSRNWHEAYLLVLAIGTGLIGLTGGLRAGAVENSFPPWARAAWYGGIITGAVLGCAGIWYASHLGLWFELAAMVILAGLCAGYLFAVVMFAPRTADTASSAVFVTLFIAANAARGRQIRGELRRIHHIARSIAAGDRHG